MLKAGQKHFINLDLRGCFGNEVELEETPGYGADSVRGRLV